MTTSTDRQIYREVLAGLAAKTLTKIPTLNGRTEKACKLVLGGDVELHSDGTALVNSLTDPSRAYLVVKGACDCRDFEQAPEHLCCHRLAVGFARKVQELVPLATPDITAGSNIASTPPLGEAPASCNVYVQIGGHKVQVTLRDSDEQRMLERLQILLDRYPAAPERGREPQTPTVETPVCKYHGQMKASTKAPGTWYCASKMGDGSYCKERYPQA